MRENKNVVKRAPHSLRGSGLSSPRLMHTPFNPPSRPPAQDLPGSSSLVQVFVCTRIMGDILWFSSRELSSKRKKKEKKKEKKNFALFHDLGRVSNYCLLVSAVLLGYRMLLEASLFPSKKAGLSGDYHKGSPFKKMNSSAKFLVI